MEGSSYTLVGTDVQDSDGAAARALLKPSLQMSNVRRQPMFPASQAFLQ